mgnify:CR=1 FL=1
MQDIIKQIATPEVFTVLTALVLAFLGYQGLGKLGSLVGGWAKNASYSKVVALVLALAGFSATGLGIGDIQSHNNQTSQEEDQIKMENPDGFTNDQLMTLLTNENTISVEMLQHILKYTQSRDDKLPEADLLEMAKNDAELRKEIVALFRQREENRKRELEMHSLPKSFSLTSYDADPITDEKQDDTTEFELVKAEEPPSQAIMSKPFSCMTTFLGIGMLIGSGLAFRYRNEKIV